MSVIKAKRQVGKFEVLTKAREMCAYTITMCKTEKHFPKRNRWLLTQPIVNEAIAVFTCIRKANAVKVVEKEDYVYRRGQQVEAFAHAEALLGLIDIAYTELGIESRCIEHWTGLIIEVEEKLKGWRKSDRDRYKSIREGQTAAVMDGSAPAQGD